MFMGVVSPYIYIIPLALDSLYYVGTTSRPLGGTPLGRGPRGGLLFLRSTILSELDILTTREFLVATQ